MAFVYRYRFIKNEDINENDGNRIIEIISRIFKENLKDAYFTRAFFEFKLYMTEGNWILRLLGRQIK